MSNKDDKAPTDMRASGGTSLHRRLVIIFGFMATVPALLLVTFAALVLHYGVQVMFSDQVKTAVNNAEAVATAYLNEHRQTIRADVLAMANDIDRQAGLIIANPKDLDRFMDTQSFLRNFYQAVLFDDEGRILAQGGVGLGFSVEDVPLQARQDVGAGEVEIFTQSEDDQKIHALVRLNNFSGAYLYVNRGIDAQVLSYVQETRQATTTFNALEGRRAALQQRFMLLFLAVCAIVVLASIMAGLYLATQLARPIEQLVHAADRVRSGDFDVQIPERHQSDDFAVLNRTFNRMTTELAIQRRELQFAERRAAWADVARRVAHEIKNPLTPVQLSAERLRRRFLKNIPVDEQAVYIQCIDTIIRHVGDIGRMAGEFASFARMPAPILALGDVGDLVRDVAALHHQPGQVTVDTAGIFLTPALLPAMMDAGQIRQALTNLVVNAVQSVQASENHNGRVQIFGAQTDTHYLIHIMDNGLGFPANVALERLGEPYVTYKENGTGLGLAVVKKIIDDHGGTVKLGGFDDQREAQGFAGTGAVVTITLPLPLAKNLQMQDNQSHAA